MARYYDEQVVQEIQDRLDIVDIVSETVNLSRKGNRYWGLCPFHQEKTPSFSVTPDKNMFYCFGCHAGGDIFSFVMKRDGLDFKEALELLAARAGIELIDANRNNKQVDRRKKVIEVNTAAAKFYHQYLVKNNYSTALNYLKERGVKTETIEEFNLGYAPDSWTMLQEYLFKKGYSQEFMKLSGLIKRSDRQNSFFDLLRNRIIFPIHSSRGDIIGFGGRVMGDSLPKYLNTPETEIYSKRKNLYGLFQARDTIRLMNEVILVEGYMDCIKLHQGDIKNCVASLGTAFTSEQALLLQRYTEKVVILYDGDEAGQRETVRAIDIMAQYGLKIDVVTLPGGKDPDDCMETYGKEEFLKYIQNNKISYIEFKINRYINAEKVLNLESKSKIITWLKKDINKLGSEIEKDYFIKLLARKLRLEENVVYREFANGINSIKGNKSRTNRDNIRYGNYSIEEKILAAMLFSEDIFLKIKNSIGVQFFSKQEYRELIEIYQQMEGTDTLKLGKMQKAAGERGIDAVLARIMVVNEDTPLQQIEIERFIKRVKKLREEANWQKIYRSLDKLQEEGNFINLLNFILNLDTFNHTQEGGIK
ncbi:MAG: DNA primase [Syntrophomonadaceae bacterium]|nr:DNA primase [Syntrophomonadaceae bacterium]MDD3889095.1 DNA primase [Syntrophomonadaceae bacterium]